MSDESKNSNETQEAGQDLIDEQIVADFQLESKNLIDQMTEILDSCEGEFDNVKDLEKFGQTVDRIMGGAKSLAVMFTDQSHVIHQIGDYAAICKAVGYKASQIKDNPQFFNICVALLQDATETLDEMVESVTEQNARNVKELLSKTFLERLKWVSAQFGNEYRESVEVNQNSGKMNQGEIDDLLRKLGLD